MITINNISKSFGNVKALNEVSLDIKKGELFGLIGPDGAGKSTLIRILMTLLYPDSGNAEMNGLDVVKDYKQIRHMVGYMPGKFSLYQDLSVEENLQFFATVFGTTIDKNYDLIRDIYSHIEPYKTRRAGKLSGGMKQKLALSCALVHSPMILVLDEPTTGVDAVSRKEFWEMLKKLQENDITILVSTPYMDEAILCDRIALMQKGKVMDVDTPDGVVNKYPHRVIRVRADKIYQLIKDLRQYATTRSAYGFGQFVHFTATNNDVTVQELVEYLHSKNHRNVFAEEIAPGIEDVFIGRMQED